MKYGTKNMVDMAKAIILRGDCDFWRLYLSTFSLVNFLKRLMEVASNPNCFISFRFF